MALANKGADVEVEMNSRNESLVKDTDFARNSSNGIFAIRTQMEKILLIVAVILLILCIVFIALLAKETSDNDSSKESSTGGRVGSLCGIQPCVNNGTCKEKDDKITCTCASGFTGERCEKIQVPTTPPKPTAKPTVKPSDEYVYSDEAQRVKFPEFIKKVQDTYYEYNRDQFAWQSHKNVVEITDDLKTRHLAYNATPAYLKAKTDAAFKLLDEINSTALDENLMTPREVKALEQVKHFLRTVFGAPFDENFYNGDWMLGPNHFCWQAICSISYDINAYGYYVNPTNFSETEKMIEKILANKGSIEQYKSNMQLGVKTGMVRSEFNCISGIDAFKQEFKKIASENNPAHVLDEWFVKYYIRDEFTEDFSQVEMDKWFAKYNKTFMQTVNDSLIEGIGQPVVDLIDYMENVHLKHCLPKDLASGIAELPVEFIYLNGNATSTRTTRRLPITNEILDGKKSYKNILPYFTTSEITPERINEIGHERLNALYPQVVEIAKTVTNISDQDNAIKEFQKILNAQSSYYNDAPFPKIESNGTAHKRCTDLEKAKKYCPKRYESLLKWMATCRQTMSMLSPKLISLFYHTGDKITVPNCPIDMLPSFNPSSGAQFFRGTNAKCKKPAQFGLPFFLENHGPRFSEWSVTAHEAWPGHHTQIQGQTEYFKDKYGGVPKWIDDKTYYTFFTEGWGLYSENPVIAKDTDTYEGELMQKFGMLKWQVWRALRLIVDTGLHYRGMNRTTALWYFSEYAWDSSDLAQKEITRYQGVPGQATAYMLGQQKLVQLRDYAKKMIEANGTFSIQDFHYQVLSQGSAPEAYLQKHVTKYVQCTLGTLNGTTCDVILNPPKKKVTPTVVDEGPPQPPRRHYY